MLSEVFEAVAEGVVGLVDVGGFACDAIELEDDEAFAATEVFFVGNADIVAAEVEAFVREADFVERLGELGGDPVAGVFEDGSEAVGAEFGEDDFFASGGNLGEADLELLEEVFGHCGGAWVIEEEALKGVLSVSSEALGELASEGGDFS